MPLYYLERKGIKYKICFNKAQGEKPPYCFVTVSKDSSHELSTLEAEEVYSSGIPNIQRNGYSSTNTNPEYRKAIQQLLIIRKGDILTIVSNEKTEDITKDTKAVATFEEIKTEYELETPKPLSFLDRFPPLSNRTKRILGFIGLGLLTSALIAVTVLTAGAAAGVILPGAAGFVAAMSSITGLSALSLTSIPAFMGLAAVAMGSFLTGIFTFGSMMRTGFLHQGEDFFRVPVALKKWFVKLSPLKKVVLAVGLALLGLGLLALGAWSIAGIVGVLAVPAIVGPVLGSLAGGFLSSLAGVVTLLGVSFASFTLGFGALRTALGFGLEAKDDRDPAVDKNRYTKGSANNGTVKWTAKPHFDKEWYKEELYDIDIPDENDSDVTIDNFSLFDEVYKALPDLSKRTVDTLLYDAKL